MACLVEEKANKFLNGLKSGSINPNVLSKMTSEQRRSFLEKFVGSDNAKWVNTEFESKLLLKNQKQGMITWAKKIGNLKKPAKRDILSKIEKLDNALSESDQESFLEDIVEKRLGISITEDEANKIFDLTKKIKGLEKGTKKYGTAKQELVAFMREHSPVEKIHPIADVLGVMRSMKTGFDLSAIGRQGASMFGTKQWNESFKKMFGYAKSQSNLDALEAEMYGDKYSDQLLSNKKDLGLTLLGESFIQREEEFASRFVKKVPFLEGSSRAYEGFLNKLRKQRFVDTLEQYDKAGHGITSDKKAMKDLAQVISAATGRGTLGSAEGAAKALATVMFSPRWVTSRVQTMLNPFTKRGPAQKEAAKALARTIGISTGILGLLAMAGADVEKDPRSSDFGKVKIGNTRYDLTGGMGSYITLISRLLKGQSKSSVTGKVSELNTGEYSARTKEDVIISFLRNKASPVASVVRDYLSGKTFEGEEFKLDQPVKKTVNYLFDNLIKPMLYTEVRDAYKEASSENKIATGIGAGVASLFGISTGSYQFTPQNKKWKDLKEKNEKLYNSKLDQARNIFSKRMEVLKKTDRFQAAPETGENSQADMIDNQKKIVNNKIFKQ